MITKPITLILGAGASIPYGFPSGEKLIDRILENTYKVEETAYIYADNKARKELNTAGFSFELIDEFHNSLKKAGRKSIDEFLEYRQEYIDIGKATIAQVILSCETSNIFWPKTESVFMSNEINTTHICKEHWLEYLWGKMDSSFEDFRNNKISIITFNYDRSFEYYFITVLQNAFGKSTEECYDVFKFIPIVHIHGKLGRFSYENGNESIVGYGDTNNFIEASKSINILHENIDNNYEVQKARDIILESDKIYCLGFGYHQTNIDRLGINEFRKQVIGTSLNMTTSEVGDIGEKNSYVNPFNKPKWTSLDFMRNYIRWK